MISYIRQGIVYHGNLSDIIDRCDESRMEEYGVEHADNSDLIADKVTADLADDLGTTPIVRVARQKQSTKLVIRSRFADRIRPESTKSTEKSGRRPCKDHPDQIAGAAKLENGLPDDGRRSRVSKLWRDH